MGVIARRNALTAAVLGAGSAALAGCGSPLDPRGGGGGEIALTVATNAISGGKNADEAEWIERWVIPRFVARQREQGVDVRVDFLPSGVDDEQYKTKLALDLKAHAGPDIMSLDGIWVGEFAQAEYIKPLREVAGPDVADWAGWRQISAKVRALARFEGRLYGIPAGTDARVLYFHKPLFRRAQLPVDWQPGSWQDILDAARKLKRLQGVVPLQINAGTAMGEATTMQGVLPLLSGAGGRLAKGTAGTATPQSSAPCSASTATSTEAAWGTRSCNRRPRAGTSRSSGSRRAASAFSPRGTTSGGT